MKPVPETHKPCFPAVADALAAEGERFLEASRVRGCAAATVRSHAGALRVFFAFLGTLGVDDVRAITAATVRAYAAWLAQRGERVATQHVRLVCLRRFFEHLQKLDAVLVNPCVGFVLPKLPDRLPRHVLTRAQARRVLDAPDTATKTGLRDRALLELIYSTGLRLGEVARLSVHDVDCRTGFVRVHGGKGAKDRVVPLGRAAADYVAEYLRVTRAEWARHQREERALWLSAIRPHGPIKDQAVSVMLKNYLRACGIKAGRAHVWRHSCATHLVAEGANIAYVQRLLGHRRLETTQIYTRVTPTEARATHRRTHPRGRVKDPAPTPPAGGDGASSLPPRP
ncbi:MAG: tyrosine-type recombinase/integrase [Opitutaceae bacterium]